MTLKHILLELQQWFRLKMQEKKARRRFVLMVCAVVAVLIAGTAVNGLIMQKQFEHMGSYSAPFERSEGSSQSSWSENGGHHDWKRQHGGQSESSKSALEGKTGDTSTPMGTGMGMEPTPLTSGIIMVSILSAAVIAAMVMYLHYRKRHMDHIPPLTVLKMRED